ncbi:hypothetical protein R1sor_018781 [Riccia sorocarpa]|uniref:Uncharacterized protein n=1 Tax=Riccia sorocarpa TaxID=122646 RepID=A0ABD3IGW6_9MARC
MADEPIEPIVTQAPPIVTQSTPRRRGLGEGPLEPDELVTIANVHRLVTHEMIWEVFPERVAVGRNRDGTPNMKEFKSEARRSHIRVMKDCTSAAMKAAVEEGFPIYYADEYSRRGTPVDGRGFEFTLGYVKLLYARAVFGRRVDWSRISEPVADAPVSQTPRTQTPRTPRKVRPRLAVPGEIDFGAIDSGSGSHAPIVPHGEGPSSAPSPPLHPGSTEAVGRDEGLEARLEAEFEIRFQTRLAEAEEATRQAEEALQRANLAVRDLTSRVTSADIRLDELHAEILQKDMRIENLLVHVNALQADLDAERADRNELIFELDKAEGHVQDIAPAHPEVQPDVHVQVQAEVQVQSDV